MAMEDISQSDEWRLGAAEDMDDTQVARGLARWYFALHEAGADVPELDSCTSNTTPSPGKHRRAARKMPEAAELFSHLLNRFDVCAPLSKGLNAPSPTTTFTGRTSSSAGISARR
jgi:hypothetical protein